MKPERLGTLMVFLLGLLVSLIGGCGPAPYCQTSLVTMDETRLDVETYEQEVAETEGKIADLEGKLNAKNEEIGQIKEKPAELEKKVYEMKKGSGRE
jgi:septal ring factor EnvC (AmiA/AmiB activator)